MEFMGKLRMLSDKIRQQGNSIKTEEATKTAFVLPFIHSVLGYDIFNPDEVIPEYVCDIGTKKGEKIDYAITRDGDIQILFECKKLGESLNLNHAGQLFRYFHVTNARIAVLTNGQVYQFFTDLDSPNKMDEKPFLVLDLSDIDDYVVPELIKITKSDFDVESIVSAAGELKYVSQIKKVLATQFSSPEEEFVKFLASRVYDGILTQKVREQFSELTRKATSQYLNDRINERLKSAMTGEATSSPVNEMATRTDTETDAPVEMEDLSTTEDEIEGYHIVKAIVRAVVDAKRVTIRDAKSYCSVLLDDNNRKPLCRLHFNRAQKYIGIFDKDKNETRLPLSHIDEIYAMADELKETALSYEVS